MGRFTGLLGLVVILGVAWLFSSHKRAIKLRIIAWGLGLQFAFALLVLKTDFGKLFQAIGVGRERHARLTPRRAARSCSATAGHASSGPFGVVFAFQVLPIVIFIASFFAILYYLGVMQWVVRGMAMGMQKVMGASGAESLNVAASIFMGQTEAPLTIQPVPCRPDRVRTVHHHDQRHGARLRRGDGGLRQDRRRARSSTC